MSVLLHYPKPDETWQSVVASFLHGWSRTARWRWATHLLGSARAPVAFDYPRGILRCVERLPGELGLTSARILLNYTLLPVNRPFLSRRRWSLVTKAALANRHVHFSLGVASSRIASPVFLRLCLGCIEDDRRVWGCAYWHRTHQLPGVIVCPRHKEILCPTNVRTRRSAAFELVAAEDAQLFAPDRFTRQERAFMATIAGDLSQLLSSDCPTPGAERLRAAYRFELNKGGFLTPRGRIANQRLCRCFTDFAGDMLLARLGCDVDEVRRDHWIIRLISHSRWHQAPLRHVLFIRFLGHDAKSFLRRACGCTPLRPRRRALREPKRQVHVSRETIELKRLAWLEILGETGNRRQRHDALYSWLWRNDRLWLAGQNRRAGSQLLLPLSSNRDLDEQLAKEVRAAAGAAIREDPASRLSRRWIAEHTSRPNLVQANTPSLPATMAAIEAMVEAVDKCALRKLALAARRLYPTKRHQRWRLVAAAGLNAAVEKLPQVAQQLDSLVWPQLP